MTAEHWAAQYIGRPWELGAQGPESFDCFGFVRYVLRVHFAIDLPLITTCSVPRYEQYSKLQHRLIGASLISKHPERDNWTLVKGAPRDGDTVLLGVNRLPSHVGIWADIDGGGVLHCLDELAGVVFQKPPALTVTGWTRIDIYRHKSKA